MPPKRRTWRRVEAFDELVAAQRTLPERFEARRALDEARRVREAERATVEAR